jgi:hypothetical protein
VEIKRQHYRNYLQIDWMGTTEDNLGFRAPLSLFSAARIFNFRAGFLFDWGAIWKQGSISQRR